MNYIKLHQGDNVVRIATLPFKFLAHKSSPNKFRLCQTMYGSKCLACLSVRDNWVTRAYYNLGVIKDDKAYLLSFGNKFYLKLGKFIKTNGDPKNYNINIFVEADWDNVEFLPQGNFLSESSNLLLNKFRESCLKNSVKEIRFNDIIQYY